MDAAALFKAWQNNSDLKTRVIAERLGISDSYCSRVLNGKRQPDGELAFQIQYLTTGAVPAETWFPDAKKWHRTYQQGG